MGDFGVPHREQMRTTMCIFKLKADGNRKEKTMDRFKKWIIAAGIRALKTFAEGLVTLIGTDYISIVDLDWPHMLGISATMALVSLLISIAGLPELKEGE